MSRSPHAAQLTAVVADADEAELVAAAQALQEVGRVLAHHEQMAPSSALVPTAHLHANVGQQRSHTTNGLFGELDARRSRALMDVVTHDARPLVQLRSLGGAVNDVDPGATAYAHRHQEFLATVTASPPSGRHELDAVWSAAADLVDGAYVNFESAPGPQAWSRSFPGSPAVDCATSVHASTRTPCSAATRLTGQPPHRHRPLPVGSDLARSPGHDAGRPRTVCPWPSGAAGRSPPTGPASLRTPPTGPDARGGGVSCSGLPR